MSVIMNKMSLNVNKYKRYPTEVNDGETNEKRYYISNCLWQTKKEAPELGS